MERKFNRKIKRIVVKVGSSVIANDKMKPNSLFLKSLVNQISSLRKQNIEVLLVSSGAIVFGMGVLNIKKRPTELANLQALAAVGQTVLMDRYRYYFRFVVLVWKQISQPHPSP